MYSVNAQHIQGLTVILITIHKHKSRFGYIKSSRQEVKLQGKNLSIYQRCHQGRDSTTKLTLVFNFVFFFLKKSYQMKKVNCRGLGNTKVPKMLKYNQTKFLPLPSIALL